MIRRRWRRRCSPCWRAWTDTGPGGCPAGPSTAHRRQSVGATWPYRLAYDPEVIRKLEAETDGVLYISGSGQLVRALRDGLVDNLHLFVYPIALGTGERFFDDATTKLALISTDVYDNGVVHLNYEPAAD